LLSKQQAASSSVSAFTFFFRYIIMKLDNLHFALIAIVVLLVVLCGRDLVEGNSSGPPSSCDETCPAGAQQSECEALEYDASCGHFQREDRACKWDAADRTCKAVAGSGTQGTSQCPQQSGEPACESIYNYKYILRGGKPICKWCGAKPEGQRCLARAELTGDQCPGQ